MDIGRVIGAYLTFQRGRPFWRKWKPAWGIKKRRAGGLWVWAMLFVLAWSSVDFNLHEVYRPVTHALFGMREHVLQPTLSTPQAEPGLGWMAGYERGRTLMAREIERSGLRALREYSAAAG